MLTCSHQNRMPEAALARVAESQAGSGRHRCILCAYAQGVKASRGVINIASLQGTEGCKHGSRALTMLLAGLPESQAGVGRHKCATCAFQLGFDAEITDAESQARADVATERATHGGDDAKGYAEGRELLRLSRTYERDPRNRRLAIQAHGTTCVVCGFNFDKFYGAEYARSYVEIHHLISLAKGGEKICDPAVDLRPLCANCHSMAHRNPTQVLSIVDLKGLIEQARVAEL